ncbi:DUF1631 family protein [Sinimarinibacterium flocculans]|uniref:DUF1631 family protein n=1 Tax=Sinimarinibacterium flocculans TaxID=985250 RepID=UPI00351956C7
MSRMPDSDATRLSAAAVGPASSEVLKMGTPAINALRRSVSVALTSVFKPFFAQLPEALRRRASVTVLVAEQRNCTALARAVASDPSRWLDEVLVRVDISLTGSAESAKLATSRATANDVMVLTPPQLRAETQFAALIGEFDTQLDLIRRSVRFPIHAGALAPASLCRALRDTAVALNYGSAHLRVLFDQFDTLVLPQLPSLYEKLLGSLTDIASRAAEAEAMLAHEQARSEAIRRQPPAESPAPKPAPPAAGSAVTREAPAPAAVPAPAPPADGSPAATPSRRKTDTIDDKTASMLASVRERVPVSNDTYNDGSLAGDLLALQGDTPLPSGTEVPVDKRKAPLQRIALAGQFLNEAIEDPFVPEELGPQHESVRFPLVKSALTDATLFTAVTHPLRSLVNELMLKSATSRITGTAEARHMAAVLQQVLVQFDLAPDFVREAMLNAEPISDKQINSFFSSQKQHAEKRRETVINEAKRLVVRELELRTFGRAVPQPVIRFFNTFWGPLLVKGLLQYGADHDHWRNGLDLMERLLDLIETPPDDPQAAWRELISKMSTALAGAKLDATRIKSALSLLEAARKAPRPRQTL